MVLSFFILKLFTGLAIANDPSADDDTCKNMPQKKLVDNQQVEQTNLFKQCSLMIQLVSGFITLDLTALT